MIDTKGFQSLLTLVDTTVNDSFELYYGLFMYNQVQPACSWLMPRLTLPHALVFAWPLSYD